MTPENLFLIVFAGQIALISGVFTVTMLRRMNFVFSNYPPETHPRLYPRPRAYYERRREIFRAANILIIVVGIGALFVLARGDYDRDVLNSAALGYFLLQFVPLLWLEVSLRRELKLMRDLDTRSTRSADLEPRRVFDVISPPLFWLVVAVYFAFWIFTTWFRQFDYPWFGGYVNNLVITGMNLFFIAIVAWNLRGRTSNPHLSTRDRLRVARRVATVLALVSIAATLYAVLTISLSAAEAREWQPVARSLYFQLIALLSFATYRFDDLDLDVYRADGAGNGAPATDSVQ